MSALSPESHDLLDAACDGDVLADADQRRLKGAILTKVAAGAAVTVAASTVATKAAAGKAAVAGGTIAATASTTLTLSKVLGGVFLVGVLGVGAQRVLSQPEAAPPQTPPQTPATMLGDAPAGEATRTTGPVAAAETDPPLAADSDPDAADPDRAAKANAAAPTAARDVGAKSVAKLDPPATAATPDRSLAEEAALLQRAQAELRAGNNDAALKLLEEHRSGYADGAMAEERQAAQVLALCAAGRIEQGRDAARAFMAAHPKSPHRSRVSAACSDQ
jgi:hypothetical protein